MIQLFKVPDYTCDASQFKNLLHDDIKYEVEERVATYLGAKYAVGVTSCTAAIFLALKSLKRPVYCTVPSLMTTRFLGAIIHSGNQYLFTDYNEWVGNEYTLYLDTAMKIIDSAQRFDPLQFKECDDNDLLLVSNYPTKPVGGLRGGFIVSNDKERIDWIRQAAYFGERFSVNSWEGVPGFPGWQMYMDSVQAWYINESLNRYEEKRAKLDEVREIYKQRLDCVTSDSYHLFRVRVLNNERAMKEMFDKGILTGIHYKAAHTSQVYGKGGYYDKSMHDASTCLSIPFHEDLTKNEIDEVCTALS